MRCVCLTTVVSIFRYNTINTLAEFFVFCILYIHVYVGRTVFKYSYI